MLSSRLLLSSGILAALAVGPLSAQDDGESALILFGSAGFLNSPEDFDVFRDVAYDGGIQIGGGIGLQLYENVTVRGDFAWVRNSGREAAPVNEDVDFSRVYSGASLEVSLPLDSGVSPYVFGGGGFVSLDRDAPDYAYDVTEGAGSSEGGCGSRLLDPRSNSSGRARPGCTRITPSPSCRPTWSSAPASAGFCPCSVAGRGRCPPGYATSLEGLDESDTAVRCPPLALSAAPGDAGGRQGG